MWREHFRYLFNNDCERCSSLDWLSSFTPLINGVGGQGEEEGERVIWGKMGDLEGVSSFTMDGRCQLGLYKYLCLFVTPLLCKITPTRWAVVKKI